ncbi:NAD(P)/FAD-dependent oxidoreductase [Dongia sp.]|uniref:NAD(P)/FAD-dependent oxidoreductase n=1 Tax=Dongia sp. TaxID=1977262 RepID=UPI0035B13AD2
MARLVVIGAGAMGLAAAFHAIRRGLQVTVLETDSVAGGMAAHFDLAGLDIERFYHFVCRPDRATFDLLAELGLADQIRWRRTSMGYFYQGAVHPWGDPISLLRFPHLSLMAKLRYGLHAFVSMHRRSWLDLDEIEAVGWLRKWVGAEAYDAVWRKLMELKFHEYTDRISAAWIWARIHRAGRSRRSMFQEELGYIEGGTRTLIDRLSQRILNAGSSIRLASPASRVLVEGGAVTGVVVGDETLPADAVISTVPLPLVPRLIPDLPVAELQALEAMQNIGVVCVVHKLKRSLSPHFWININDPRIDVPGMIEFSNLRPLGDAHVVYIPYYMPVSHPLFQADDADFVARTRNYMRMINPSLSETDFLASAVGRLKHAQPICMPGFAKTLPQVRSKISGLQVADTSSYYPEDRGISESVRLGRSMAEAIP